MTTWAGFTPPVLRLPFAGITFTRQHIHIPTATSMERGMDDIRSPEDNRAAADFITAQVRHFTADPQCALHVSIAGVGRKTMGVWGYALSLYWSRKTA